MNKLDEITVSDLSGVQSLDGLAAAEGWTPETYSLELARHIRDDRVALDAHRERLQVVVQVGAGADRAAADELAQHHLILSALFHRFARASSDAMASGRPRADQTAERYLSAALKAQRAVLATMSAIAVLRDRAKVVDPTTSAPMEPDRVAVAP